MIKFNKMFKPTQIRFGAIVCLIKGDQIKTTGAVFQTVVLPVQPSLRRFDPTLLFLSGNAFPSFAKLIVTALPHFDKHQEIAVLHHQIQFATGEKLIGGNKAQPLSF